jgi:tRNA dimethylallyltransferase
MDIGTAKASEQERSKIKHHLIDIIDADEDFSVAQYVKKASECADSIISQGKIPIVVGGTGLYLSSLMDNTSFTEMTGDAEFCRKAQEEYDTYGGAYMLEKLRGIDPIAAAKLHENDKKRIIRALEIFHISGMTPTQQNEQSKKNPSPYEFYPVLLTYKDRQLLYDRIDERVDEMMASGLLEEAKLFYGRKLSRTAVQAIGYKELFEFFEGKTSLDEAVENIKKGSRHLAKRQLTWFNRDSRYNRFEVDTEGIECISDKILSDLRK